MIQLLSTVAALLASATLAVQLNQQADAWQPEETMLGQCGCEAEAGVDSHDGVVDLPCPCSSVLDIWKP